MDGPYACEDGRGWTAQLLILNDKNHKIPIQNHKISFLPLPNNWKRSRVALHCMYSGVRRYHSARMYVGMYVRMYVLRTPYICWPCRRPMPWYSGSYLSYCHTVLEVNTEYKGHHRLRATKDINSESSWFLNPSFFVHGPYLHYLNVDIWRIWREVGVGLILSPLGSSF